MNGFLSPQEIAGEVVKSGVKKAGLKGLSMFLLAVLAGVFIGLGGLGNIIASSDGSSLGKFLGAAIFPAGLVLVVVAGAELFTGNNLMTLARMERKITTRRLLRNWGIVWLGNLVGSVILALVVWGSGVLSGGASVRATMIAETKVDMPVVAMILRGVLCNILVVLAVWMATGAKDVAGKILVIWFPIMLFVFCGFEHSVANMFFLPLGAFLGAGVSLGSMVLNIAMVTIGNLIGGAVIIPVIYRLAYLRK